MTIITTVNQLVDAEVDEKTLQRFTGSKWQNDNFELYHWESIKTMIVKGEIRIKPEPVVFYEQKNNEGYTIWLEVAGGVVIRGVEYSATGRTTEPVHIIEGTT